MKKLYSKPEIMFESFTISTNIAGDCDIKTHTPSDGKCALENDNGWEIEALFTDKVSACIIKQPDGYNDICYDTFNGGDVLFNS